MTLCAVCVCSICRCATYKHLHRCKHDTYIRTLYTVFVSVQCIQHCACVAFMCCCMHMCDANEVLIHAYNNMHCDWSVSAAPDVQYSRHCIVE